MTGGDALGGETGPGDGGTTAGAAAQRAAADPGARDAAATPRAAAAAERATAAAQVFVDGVGAPALADADAHHLQRVLRLADGAVVVAADGRGSWRQCRLRLSSAGHGPSVDTSGVALEPDGPIYEDPPPEASVTVAFAPVKGDRPEWTVQKLTELGVDRIVPLETDRSVVRWRGDRAARARARLARVAREAAAQSRRTWLPEIGEVSTPDALASGPVPGGPWCLASLGGGPPTGDLRAVAVGPEGGWSPAELAISLPHLGLGLPVLRAETAAVAAAVLLTALRAGTVAPVGKGSGPA